ncbi:MAG: GNAT family N-acetyltransferase [Solirubrobacteraceae bacterium]
MAADRGADRRGAGPPRIGSSGDAARPRARRFHRRTDWRFVRVARLDRVTDPLRPEHADELAPVLDDASLHRYIGGEPAGIEELRARVERQVRGGSLDGRERWLNWTVRERLTGRAVGTVQATVSGSERNLVAALAWVIGSTHQGQGFAKEATGVMASWLRERGAGCLRAHIHPHHDASMAVARHIGLQPTNVMVDGELRWESPQQR